MAVIIRERDNWLRLLFVWRGSVLPQILPRLAVLVHNRLLYKVPLTAVPFTLLGTMLASFPSFYNNASYGRFWEGHKLWDALFNTTHPFARQATWPLAAARAYEEHISRLRFRSIFFSQWQPLKTTWAGG